MNDNTKTVLRLSLPFLTGVLLLSSFPPLGLFPLAWIAVAPLAVFALSEEKRWRRWLLTYAAGYVTMTAAFYWTRHVAPVGPWGLAIYFGLYFPIFALLLRLMVRGAGIPPMLAAPPAWIACDFLRGTLFTGLPYYLLGHSQAPFGPLCQAADLGGVHLVSVPPLLAGGFVAGLLLREKRRVRLQVAAAVTVPVAFVAYGLWRASSLELRDGPRVGIVQPNVPQDVKELIKLYRSADDIHRRTAELTDAMEPCDLVVWPESAWLRPVCIDPKKPQEIWSLQPINLLERAPEHFLFGCERYDAAPGDDLRNVDAYVGAVLVDARGRVVGVHDKVHLVPFGEYVPLKDMKLAQDIYGAFSNMARAPRFRPGAELRSLDAGGHRFGALICYEAVFPEIAREQAAKGASFYVNLSNEGWFRDSAELPLMADICRFRAIENRRAMVRATNTGISGFILPTGQVDAGLDPHTQQTLVRTVRTTDEKTVYGSIGEAFPVGCLGLVGLAAGIAAARRVRANRH